MGKTKHGLSKTKVYGAWSGAMARCYNSKVAGFKSYGAKGVKVCARWRESVENFLADMGHPKPAEFLDRINPAGNYEPKNCRWVTEKISGQNQRHTWYLKFRGEVKSAAEWSKEMGTNSASVVQRIQKGETDPHRIFFNGKLPHRSFKPGPATAETPILLPRQNAD